DRRGAAAKPDLQPAAADLVEHADFLDQPQRVIERERVDQRPEPQAPGALRHGCQINARGGRHAERGEVMLGDVIGVKPGALEGFDHAKARLVELIERNIATIEMIEHADVVHVLSNTFLTYAPRPRRPPADRTWY